MMIHLASRAVPLLVVSVLFGQLGIASAQTGVCPIRACCEEDCCGTGTSWSGGLCVPDVSSGGFNGTYSSDYVEGCNLRKCCESACCAAGTLFYVERCLVTLPPTAPFMAPPSAPETPPTPAPPACPKIEIRVTDFCIKGNPFPKKPSQFELSVKVDLQGDEKYSKDFKTVKYDSCLTLADPPFKTIESHNPIKVGIVSLVGTPVRFNVPADSWYVDTCEKYTVYIYYDFSDKGTVTTCLSVGKDVKLDPSQTSCKGFKEPANHYLWIVEVVPKK